MIAESVVLFRVQRFQQGGRRVAAKIVAQLVHFIENDDGIARAGLFQGLDDASRHGADVGAAVAAYFGLIVHAAKRKALEFAAHGPGNGLAERSLAHSWRAREAEYAAPGLRIELAHGQEFENAILDLVQAAMIRVQNLSGFHYVQPVAGYFFPGQLGHPFQVGSRHACFRRISVHGCQAAELLVSLLAGLFWQPGLVQGFAQGIEILFPVLVAIAKLVADGLDLLAQEIFLLGLVHALAGRALDLGLDSGDLEFPAKQVMDDFQAFKCVACLKDALGFRNLDAHVGRYKIGQAPGVINALQNAHDVRGGHAAHGKHLFGLFAHGAQKGLDCGVLRGRSLFQRLDFGFEEGLGTFVILDSCAANALHKHLDAGIVRFEHAHDLDHGANFIEIARDRILGVFLLLGKHKKVAPLFEGGLHGLD